MRKWFVSIFAVVILFHCFSISSLANDELKENSWRYDNGNVINIPTENNAADDLQLMSSPTMKGIDVSHHQGYIDWNAVNGNIDYAIIRCGFGNDDTSQDDSQWYNNANACRDLGIPFGVYIYSYANTADKAASEAEHVLRLVQGYNLSFPIYLDMEDNVQASLSASQRGQFAKIFCDKIQAAGYEVGIYANKNWWENYLTDSVFSNSSWYKWVAQYNTSCTYAGSYTMWQYTSSGSVSGISGNVDMNYWYGEWRGASSSATVTTTTADNITKTNATVRGTASYSGTRPTEAGIYFGTSSENMSKVASDTINHNRNPFDMWYDLNSEAGQYLNAGTTYYWQCYVVVNGVEYRGDIKSFTTLADENTATPAPTPTPTPTPALCSEITVKGNFSVSNLVLTNSISAEIQNLSNNSITGTVAIVYKNNDGNLIDVHIKEMNIPSESSQTVSDSISRDVINASLNKVDSAEVYFWDSIMNMKPLCNTATYKFNYE